MVYLLGNKYCMEQVAKYFLFCLTIFYIETGNIFQFSKIACKRLAKWVKPKEPTKHSKEKY